MFKQLFKRASRLSQLSSSPICDHLETLAISLKERRYANDTIRYYVTICEIFARWLAANSISLSSLGESIVEKFANCPAESVGSVDKQWKVRAGSACRALLNHLREKGVIRECSNESIEPDEVCRCLRAYECYLRQVQGLALNTGRRYGYFAKRLLRQNSKNGTIDWKKLNSKAIAEFVTSESSNRRGNGIHHVATAVRSFVRFLISQNILAASMAAAVPRAKRWVRCNIPHRLDENELIKLLKHSKKDLTPIGKRNHAITLLLARLALRSGEIIKLAIDDLDWINGCIIVRASKHRDRKLPLTKEVADALVDYLRNSRPATQHREIFIAHTAPYLPLQKSPSITYIVKCLFAKAGIKNRSGGAHILRHTVASLMVNSGVTFKDTADFLGHRYLQTTSIYAKLDLMTLSQVCMPWPGGES